MSVGLGTAVGYLSLDVTGFVAGIDSASASLGTLESKFSTTAQGLQTIGSMFSSAGTKLTATLTAPVGGFGAASVKAGTEFDSAMSQVSAVSSATGTDLEMIRDRAIEMGEKTRYSATESADAMYYMGLAGWNAQQIYAGLPGVLALGAASGEDLSRVSDIVTDSLTAFGKSADDTTEFVNVLAEASRSSNTTVDLLGESLKYVAPVAGAFGYSIQDVAVVLGTFANNGVKGSQAGTGLRQALNSLINPSDKAAAQMDKYGVSLFNSDGSTKSLMQVMQELRGTFGGLAVDIHNADGEVMSGEEIMETYGHSLPTSDMEKLTAIVQIFGVRALPGMLSVINAADDEFDSLTEAIYGAQDSYNGLGTAFGMQQTMLDNVQGDWYLLTSALGTTKILISDMAKGALRELLQKLTELVNKFNDMSPEQQEQIVKWALIAASIGPVLLVIGKTISGVGKLITTFNNLKAAFTFVTTGLTHVKEAFSLARAGLTGFASETSMLGTVLGSITAPIAAIIAIIAVLAAAFVTLWKTNEDFRNKFYDMCETIKSKFEEAGQKIVDAVNSLGFNFESIVDVLKSIWMGFCDLVAPIFEGAFTIVAGVLSGLADLFAGVIEVICGIIKGFKDGDWSLLWQGIKDIVWGVVEAIGGILDGLGEAIWGVIQTVANWFGANWTMTWDEAKQAVVDWFWDVVGWFQQLPGKIAEFFSQIWTNITTWCSNMITNITTFCSNFFNSVVTWFQQLPSTIAGFFSSIWTNITTWASNMVAKAVEVGTNFYNSVVSWFQQLPYKIGYFIGYALGTVIKWVADMIAKAYEVGSMFLNYIVTFFTQLPGKILEFITSAWNNVVAWATKMVNKAKDMAQTFLNNVVTFFTQLPGNILNFITSAWNNVTVWATNMVNKAKEMAQNFLNNVVTFFTKLPGNVLNFITSAYNNVQAWATNMVNKAKEMATNFLNNVVNTLTQLPGKVKTKLDEALQKAVQWVSDMGAKGLEAAKSLIDNFKEGAKNVAETVKSIGQNIVDGVWNGIKAAKDTFVSNVKSFFSGIVDGVKDALGIASPSKVMENEVGVWLPPGVANGFEKALPGAIKTMQKDLDEGIDDMSTNEDVDISVEGFADNLIATYNMIIDWFTSVEEKLSNSVDNMADKLMSLVQVGNQLVTPDGLVIDKTGFYDVSTRNNNTSDNQNANSTSSSDTGNRIYMIYSDKPVDEIQAAKKIRETERDLSEGF
jgi:phage-related protein